ncbi:pyruvate kinase-like isoform X2 [Trichoplusia ni]|nr:pyruvate kinase-like isoform X2 [Trichoplusia ni]
MLECYQKYDPYDINALKNAGVNIFNIDLTKANQEYYEKIKDSILEAQSMPELIKCSYNTPVTLSVTMSVNNPIEIDDRVDVIILKDVATSDQLRQFRKGNKKFSSKPILFWPTSLEIDDLNELIRMTEGIILDSSLGRFFCNFESPLKLCKQICKPVFYMFPSIVEDYYKETANDRQVLVQVHEIVENRFAGIFLRGCEGKSPLDLVQSLIRSIDIVEHEICDPSGDYLKLSRDLPLPVIPPFAVAMGASLAALKSNSRAIIVFTTSGASARVIASAAPPCPILAVTAHEATARKMHLYRKVIPLLYPKSRTTCWRRDHLNRVGFGTQFGIDTGIFNYGSKLVLLTPSDEGDIYCNGFQIVSVAEVLHAYRCTGKNFGVY